MVLGLRRQGKLGLGAVGGPPSAILSSMTMILVSMLLVLGSSSYSWRSGCCQPYPGPRQAVWVFR